jgi:hypothetical protein
MTVRVLNPAAEETIAELLLLEGRPGSRLRQHRRPEAGRS